MIGNAEFQRNLWLQLSPVRLIAAPCILGALFVLAFLSDGWVDVGHVALIVAVIIGVFWGSRVAVDSVFSELSDRTWDAQRMTVIGPVSMAFGKLFGATAFVWYVVGLCAIAIVVAVLAVPSTDPFAEFQEETDFGLLGYGLPMLILTCVLAHAVALLCGLALLGSGVGRIRFDTTLCQVAALVIGFMIYQVTKTVTYGDSVGVSWFGLVVPTELFHLGSVAIFALWAVIGTTRLMRLELQAVNSPLVIVAFMGFVCAYVFGFDLGEDTLDLVARHFPEYRTFGKFMICLGFLGIFTYLLALIEPKSSVRLRVWWTSLISGNIPTALALMPRAILGWLFCLGLAIGLVATMPGEVTPDAFEEFRDGSALPSRMEILAIPLAAVLFLARDLLLFAYWTIDQGPRGLIAACLYIVLLYVLPPMLLLALQFKLPVLLFLPVPAGEAAFMIAAPALQVVAAIVLLSRRANAKWARGLRAQTALKTS